MRQVKLTAPPGVDITVRCLECRGELFFGELLTLAAYYELLRHIKDFDHEVVITARRST